MIPLTEDTAREAPQPPRRHRIAPLAEPIIRLTLFLRIPPTVITLLSLPLGLASLILLTLGTYWPALIAILAAGAADAVDGEVARRTRRTSRAGGYLDSLSDRYVDAMLIIGLAWGVDETRSWIAAAVALFGILTTSAAKWRLAEILHIPDSQWGRDLLERTDRFLILLAGVLALAILAPRGHAPDIAFAVLVLLAVLTNLTVLQRILKAWRLLAAEDTAAKAIPVPEDPPAGEKDPKD